MLSKRVRKPKNLVAAVSASVLLIAGCADQDERIERASDLASAAMTQINGRKVDKADRRSPLQRAKIDQRAVAGTLRNDLNVRTAGARSRYAVGSIVAKPVEVLEVPLAMVAAPELNETEIPPVDLPEDEPEAAVNETNTTPRLGGKSRGLLPPPPSPEQRDRMMKTRSLAEVEQPRLRQLKVEVAEQLEQKAMMRLEQNEKYKSLPTEELQEIAEQKALKAVNRRLAEPARAQVVKRSAEALMYEKMEKLGVSGRVEKTRTGQMVIQIGADGGGLRQLGDGDDISVSALPEIAESEEISCDNPDAIDPAMLRANARLATECMVKELRASGEFEYVEKDYVFEHQFHRKPPVTAGPVIVEPNDPLWSLQWHFQNAGTDVGQSAGGAGFADFWSTQSVQGSLDVVVAVVDTGLEMAHPDIAASPNVAPGWDMVSDPRMGNDGDGRDSDPNDPGDLCNPDVPFASNSYHGTHVAGTIGAAATNNADGVAGGAWAVTIVPVRALGKCGGRLSDITDAIRWAGGLIPALDEQEEEIWNENPADIINLSIGLFETCPASLQDAIDSVTERGVIVVSAAGNARVDASFYAPGGCNNVLSVAAGDARGHIAPYSNYGDVIDILAPGGDLTRDDNGDGRPDGVLSTKTSVDCYDPVTQQGVANCFYAYEQGTSMAAPHVSAALALMMAKYPGKTPTEIAELVMENLSPRDGDECVSECSAYPGTEPLASDPTLCKRPCGAGMLNLSGLGE